MDEDGLGSPERRAVLTWSLRAEAASDRGDWPAATADWERVLAVVPDAAGGVIGECLSWALRGLLWRRLAAADVAGACSLAERDLLLRARTLAAPCQLALSLDNLAHVYGRAGRHACARRLQDAAEAQHAAAGRRR